MKVKGVRKNNTAFEIECNQIIQVKDKLIVITKADSVTIDLKYAKCEVIL